ncbi:hypothetical protein FNV43_RR09441 [Rhamnella rubrinervis]|uniref:Uncharacterized protein n=1 Tax=Rhamnella rubrinervis TaxID=2594499 RepID=A0A8K0HAU3_9ROSA|nr:hypothetical protein FNV43_RR09441 [Rhamnella rubrinervis]
MGIAVVSFPAPNHLPSSQFCYTTTKSRLHGPRTLKTHPASKPPNLLRPPSTCCSASVVEEGPPPPPDDSLSVKSKPVIEDTDTLPLRGCKACGREEVERGCNGEGRIQGGIATIPGFGWWPIKAYRPCPGFLASGGRYRRRGQNMDEVAFGRGGRGATVETTSEVESSSSIRLVKLMAKG